MTLEELAKALGLDTEENKEKFGILKKEYNAMSKAQKDSAKKIETLEAQIEENKPIIEKFDIVSKAFNFNTEAEDFDAMLDDVKETMIKEAGGGATPEELKNLRRELTKAQRDLATSTKTVTDLTEQLNTEKTHRINGVKRDAINKALQAHNVIKPEQFMDYFMNKAIIDKDEVTVTLKDDAGNELSVADAVADWAKANPEFVKKDVLGGMGTGVGGKGGSKDNSGVSSIMQAVLEAQAQSKGEGSTSLSEMFG